MEEPYKNREIDEKFKDTTDAINNLRDELMNKEWGILPKVLAQTTKHNGRLTRLEKITWVVGTAITVLAISGNSAILKAVASAFL